MTVAARVATLGRFPSLLLLSLTILMLSFGLAVQGQGAEPHDIRPTVGHEHSGDPATDPEALEHSQLCSSGCHQAVSTALTMLHGTFPAVVAAGLPTQRLPVPASWFYVSFEASPRVPPPRTLS